MKKSIEEKISNAHTTASKALTEALGAKSNSEFIVNMTQRYNDFPEFETRSVASIIQMILDHLGLEIEFHDEINSHVTLEPKKEDDNGKEK